MSYETSNSWGKSLTRVKHEGASSEGTRTVRIKDGAKHNMMTAPDMDLEQIPRLLLVDIWVDDADVVIEALDDLADLCVSDEDDSEEEKEAARKHRQDILNSGGHLAIVRVMRQWYFHAKVLTCCANVLVNASHCQAEEFLGNAVHLGTIKLLLTAMKNFPLDSTLQRYCLGALGNLSSACKENAKNLTDLGGAGVIVTALRTFPYNRDIQLWASWSLEEIGQYEDCRLAVAKAGGLKALASVMEFFDHDEELQSQANDAMLKLRGIQMV
jgi:hypothetical protein